MQPSNTLNLDNDLDLQKLAKLGGLAEQKTEKKNSDNSSTTNKEKNSKQQAQNTNSKFETSSKLDPNKTNVIVLKLALPEQVAEASKKETKNNTEAPEASRYDSKPKEKSLIKKILNSFLFKYLIPEGGNYMSIFGNLAAATAHIFDPSKNVTKFAEQLGKIGTRAFLISNGVVNVLEQLVNKNYLSSLGYLVDIVVGCTTKYSQVYLARGSASGTYTLANALSTINKKAHFSSFKDHIEHVWSGLKKSWHNFTNNPFEKMQSSENAMFGIASGIICNLGVLSWFITGNEKIATVIRDFGGILMDIEQAHPGHLKAGRKFFFSSGLGLMGGTIADFFAKIVPGTKQVLVPLSLMIDGIGRYLLRISQNRNEQEMDPNAQKA